MPSSPYQDILTVLESALECALSLQATAHEAEALLQAGEIDQVQDLYRTRGEVVKMMTDLDRRLGESMSQARPSLSGKEWGHLVETGGRLRDVLADAAQTDGQNRDRIEVECESISKELGRLRQGKQAAKSYQSAQRANAEYSA